MKKLLLFCCLLMAAGGAGAQCSASLTYSVSASNNNLLTVNFTNSSSYGLPFAGQRQTVAINYGDGNRYTNTSNSTIAPHVYSFAGTYTVGIRIRSIDSASNTQLCTDTTTITVTLTYPACGTTLNVSGAGPTRTFTANTPAGTPGMSYSWNFGDGGTGTGTPVSHTYATSGSYTITLIATNGSCTYVNTATIYVSVPPAPLNCSTLHAAFSTGTVNNPVTVINSSTIPTGNYLSLATWYYGDGTTATGYNPPPHTYAATGVYSIKLVMVWRDSAFTTYCTDSVTHNVTVTTVPAPANIISGNIFSDTPALGNNYFKVYLIKLDSATNLLSAVDSVITGNTSSPYYAFGNKPAGSYRVKAAAYNGTTTGSGLVPTYHDSSVYWSGAQVISHTGGSTLNQRIWMRNGFATTGPGFIGGSVLLGANKGTASGVPNLMIFLRDASMRVIRTQNTDASGAYAFTNVPYGAYSIWPELINYTTQPVTPIALSAARPSHNDVSFTQDDSKRSIKPSQDLGIITATAAGFITVSPVPAGNSVTISWNGLAESAASFTITSITGREVIRTEAVHGREGSLKVDVSRLAHGVYFVHGSGTLAGAITKMVIQ